MYIKRDDLVAAFSQYIKERQADTIQLISIDPNSLGFIYENLKEEQIIPTLSAANQANNANITAVSPNTQKLLMIPTKVSILQ